MSVATWLREAAQEKLERGAANGVNCEVVHLDGNPRNNDPANLEIRKRQP